MAARLTIETELVRRLVDRQFPDWADQPVRPVERNGWDNSTFRLGTDKKVRLPTAAPYVPQVEKEWRFLPRLAPHLPLPIPAPLALGRPAEGYPYPWSVYRWIEGEPTVFEQLADPIGFAVDLAQFLLALQRAPPEGPPAGVDNFHRGGALSFYDAETRRCLDQLAGEIDAAAAGRVWEAALAARWQRPPVWVHGDIAVGNLLLHEGRLSAVIDFGSSAIGDPACDLVIAWTFLRGESRAAFQAKLAEQAGFDHGIWARARGWALWKALLICCGHGSTLPTERPAREVIATVLQEHAASDRD
ncbi:aminoglycoside phosphotransferase family protein [Labrys sp. LIt4]|uniref:aminoglycoside phosphotransferase family protein n=1 Tax=Labrys sp. LIt4 TaxID=2821355 RepID=UPI001AE0C10C|nr:aminoglycoside phosphotransferase family protein [Labrys sp. LIt4]MBP0582239.1 aminoglycoside phosphotransferase family protein [Labrys sp. LIt4]